ncbi:MAG: sarcosine oxidase subunit delta [Actinomycetota bacterium]
MILIPCPHCGPRNASEFRYVGEATPRPDPRTVTPEEWRRYLYFRRNPAGWTTESWFHVAGCRRYLVLERHRETNEVRAPRPPSASTRGEQQLHEMQGAASTPAEGSE